MSRHKNWHDPRGHPKGVINEAHLDAKLKAAYAQKGVPIQTLPLWNEAGSGTHFQSV